MSEQAAKNLLDAIKNNTDGIRDKLCNEKDPDKKKVIISNAGYEVSKQDMLDALEDGTRSNTEADLEDVSNLQSYTKAAFSAQIQR